MRLRTARAIAWVSLLLLSLPLVACGKGYRQVVVVDGGKAEVVTIGTAPKKAQEIWVPDRVLVFRTDSAVPGAPPTARAKGAAGHAYRLNDSLEMEEIGEFELSIPNDTLAYRFGG
jgi:hypothetical protein